MASSSCSGSSVLMTLEELPCGVVKTFKPTEAELVGHYLYAKMMMPDGGNGKHTFPELEIYGVSGMVPWVIWESFQAVKLPHQEFIYFYTRTKKLGSKGTGKRSRRTTGCGGTWSETEPCRPVYVNCVAEPFGKFRKFRYENKDKDFEHHTAWMMEEFSIVHHSVGSSDLVLCRMKKNEAAIEKKRKRKFIVIGDEEENARRMKCHKPKEQLISDCPNEQEQPWDISDYDPQTCFDVDDLCSENVDVQVVDVVDLSGDSDDEQVVEEQGFSRIAQYQQSPTDPHFDSNCSTPDAIVSTNVIEDTELQDTCWLDGLLEGGETPTPAPAPAPAPLEQHTSSSLSMSQQQQQQEVSSHNDDQTSAFALDNEITPMDGASQFQSDECNSFNFRFEDHLGADNALLFGW